jgi:hypothetical protein
VLETGLTARATQPLQESTRLGRHRVVE